MPTGDDNHRPWIFAADFHLAGEADEAARSRFAALLTHAAEENARLLLLGDVFHYWYGRRHLAMPMYRRELELLKEATDRGLPIAIIPGNRDFLLDRTFTAATGVEVLGDDLALELGEERLHLSHGDLFATQDRGYLRLRRILRSRMILFFARYAPGFVVDALARRLRGHTARAVRTKPARLFDPDRTAVSRLFADGFDVVVCGHFHKHRDETFPEAEGGGRFVILEPFDEGGFILVHKEGRWETRRIES